MPASMYRSITYPTNVKILVIKVNMMMENLVPSHSAVRGLIDSLMPQAWRASISICTTMQIPRIKNKFRTRRIYLCSITRRRSRWRKCRTRMGWASPIIIITRKEFWRRKTPRSTSKPMKNISYRRRSKPYASYEPLSWHHCVIGLAECL